MTATGSTTYLLDDRPPSSLGLQRKAGWVLIGGACLGTAAFSSLIILAFMIDLRWLEVSYDHFRQISTYLILARDVMYLAGGIAAMIWMYTAYKRLPEFTGRPNQRKTWWAWAGLLIPGPCLFVPFRIARELAAGSRGGQPACSTRLVGLAQTSVVVALLGCGTVIYLTHADLFSNRIALGLLGTLTLSNVLACIGWTIVVLKVNEAQEQSLAWD